LRRNFTLQVFCGGKRPTGGGADLAKTAASKQDSGLCFGGKIQEKIANQNHAKPDSADFPPVSLKTCSLVNSAKEKTKPLAKFNLEFNNFWKTIAQENKPDFQKNDFCIIWRRLKNDARSTAERNNITS
jgi:hypothetical protein